MPAKRQEKRTRHGAKRESRKYTPEVAERILADIQNGNHMETAACMAGISPRTLRLWCQKGADEESRRENGKEPNHDLDYLVDFSFEVNKARATGESDLVQAMKSAARDDWRAAESLLERKNPKRWGKRVHVTLEAEYEKLIARFEKHLPDQQTLLLVLDIMAMDDSEDEE